MPTAGDRLSVCQVTLPDTTLETDLELLIASGFGGLTLHEVKLRDGEEEEQAAVIRARGITVVGAVPNHLSVLPVSPARFYPGPADPEQRIELIRASIRRMAPFRPAYVVLTTGSREGLDDSVAREAVVAGLRAAADEAADHGMAIALEPVRPGPIDASFVHELPDAVDLVNAVDRENVGICFDTYHLWDTPDIGRDAARFAARVLGVQVSDWRRPPRAARDRSLPGEGIIDLAGLLGALRNGGYRGWYDLEVLSDDGRWGTRLDDSLLFLPPAELLRRGRAGLLDALG